MNVKTKTAHRSMPVVISDDDDALPDSDKLPLGLCPEDLMILHKTSGGEAWLTDRLIHAGQQLIQMQFPSIHGLQDPILSETLTFNIERSG